MNPIARTLQTTAAIQGDTRERHVHAASTYSTEPVHLQSQRKLTFHWRDRQTAPYTKISLSRAANRESSRLLRLRPLHRKQPMRLGLISGDRVIASCARHHATRDDNRYWRVIVLASSLFRMD
jgi:hypothetical protein